MILVMGLLVLAPIIQMGSSLFILVADWGLYQKTINGQFDLEGLCKGNNNFVHSSGARLRVRGVDCSASERALKEYMDSHTLYWGRWVMEEAFDRFTFPFMSVVFIGPFNLVYTMLSRVFFFFREWDSGLVAICGAWKAMSNLIDGKRVDRTLITTLFLCIIVRSVAHFREATLE